METLALLRLRSSSRSFLGLQAPPHKMSLWVGQRHADRACALPPISGSWRLFPKDLPSAMPCSNPPARPFPLFSWAGGSTGRTSCRRMGFLNYDCACARFWSFRRPRPSSEPWPNAPAHLILCPFPGRGWGCDSLSAPRRRRRLFIEILSIFSPAHHVHKLQCSLCNNVNYAFAIKAQLQVTCRFEAFKKRPF